MPQFSRRKITLWAAILTGGSGLYALMRPAFGQETNLADLMAERKANKAESRYWDQWLRESAAVEPDQLQKISDVSFVSRRNFAVKLQAAAKTSPEVAEAEGEFQRLIDPQTAYVADEMRKADIPLSPSPAEITRDPTEPAPAPQAHPSPEQKWDVCVEVLVETFAGPDVKELLQEAMAAAAGFPAQKDKVIAALQTGLWVDIKNALYGFLDWFIEKKTLATVLAKLAADEAAKILLRRLLPMLVPFVGWGWLAVSFGLALYRHRAELMS